jgi:hypothetical protein
MKRRALGTGSWKRQDRFDEEIFLGLFLISMSGLHFGNPLVVFFGAI